MSWFFQRLEIASDGAVWTTLLSNGLKVTLLLALTVLIARLARRRSSIERYRTWSFVFVAAFLVPLLTPILPMWQLDILPASPGLTSVGQNRDLSLTTTMESAEFPAATDRANRGVTIDPLVAPIRDTHAAGTIEQTASLSQAPRAWWQRSLADLRGLSWRSWMLFAWTVGVFVTLLSLVIAMVRLSRLSQAALCVNESWANVITDVKETLGIRRTVTVATGDVTVPMTFGFFRPRVLLPKDACTWSDERLRVVLLHEFIHISRGDWIIQLVARIVSAHHWYNPLVWFAAQRLAVEREHSCDARVVVHGVRPSDYAQHLLDTARCAHHGALPVAALAMARPNQLEGRLVAILQPSTKNRRRAFWALPLLAGLISLPVAAVEVTRAPKPAPAPLPVPATSPLVRTQPLTPTRPSTAPAPMAYAVPSPLAVPRTGEIPKPGSPPLAPSSAARAYSRAVAQSQSRAPRADARVFSGNGYAFADDAGRHHYSYQKSDGRISFETKIDDVGLFVRLKGEVEFNEDGSDVIRMGRKASVLIETEDDETEQRMLIRPGAKKEIKYDWAIDGVKSELDADARAWMKAALLAFNTQMKIGEVTGERNRLFGEINRINGERNIANGEINSLRGAQNSLRGQINGLLGQENALRGEINSIYGQRNALKGRVKHLRDLVADRSRPSRPHPLEKTLERLLIEQNELLHKRGQMESRVRSDDPDTGQLDADMLKLVDEHLEDIQRAIDKTRGEMDTSDSAKPYVRPDAPDVDGQAESLVRALENLQTDERVADALQRIQDLNVEQRKMELMSKVNALELEHEKHSMNQRMVEQESERQVTTIKEKIENLKADERLESLREELKESQRKLKQAVKQIRR